MIAVEIFRWADGGLHIPAPVLVILIALFVIFVAAKYGGRDG